MEFDRDEKKKNKYIKYIRFQSKRYRIMYFVEVILLCVAISITFGYLLNRRVNGASIEEAFEGFFLNYPGFLLYIIWGITKSITIIIFTINNVPSIEKLKIDLEHEEIIYETNWGTSFISFSDMREFIYSSKNHEIILVGQNNIIKFADYFYDIRELEKFCCLTLKIKTIESSKLELTAK